MSKANRAERDEEDGEDEIPQIGTSALEWAFAAIGGLIVMAVAGYLIYSGASAPETPPVLVLRQISTHPTVEGYLLQGSVRNNGGLPASLVRVTGELLNEGTTVESSTVEMDSVPQHSERSFSLQFSVDPAKHQRRLRIEGFVEP